MGCKDLEANHRFKHKQSTFHPQKETHAFLHVTSPQKAEGQQRETQI